MFKDEIFKELIIEISFDGGGDILHKLIIILID